MENGNRFDTKRSVQVQWDIPTIQEELDELPEHAKRLGIPVETLTEAFAQGLLEELDSADWDTMENCDSAAQNWTVDEIKGYRGHERDVDTLVSGFKTDNKMYAPVVLFRKDQKPFLIGGNTRLMLCKALGIKPKIFALRIDF